MANGFVVLSVVNGNPLDSFDQEQQAKLYVDKVNRVAGDTVVRWVEVPRNPPWSVAKAPDKVGETVARAMAANGRPAWMS